ncbi:MAG: hypothetical protein NTV79_10015 [Candidatus Aureabacteria bacterium]|nr:hypothetical protein [Candidatus Auribacterota bacterium]
MAFYRPNRRWLPLIAYLAVFCALIPCSGPAASLESELSAGASSPDAGNGPARSGSFPLLIGAGVQYPHEDTVAEIGPFFLFLAIIGVGVAIFSQLQDSSTTK